MLENETVVRQAVVQGVLDGVFGLRTGERIYYNELVPLSALDYGAVLMRKEVAEQARQVVAAGSSQAGIQPAGATDHSVREPVQGVLIAPEPIPVAAGVQRLTLRVKIPWDKLSDFVRGVVMPLRSDGAELDGEVLLQARSESRSIKPSTLEQKVRETLGQIGGKIVEDFRE